jgi:hypothetical protein
MRHGMIRILAIAALLLLVGSIPGNADAARSPSIRLSQNLNLTSTPGSDDFTAHGAGFLPGIPVTVHWSACRPNAQGCTAHSDSPTADSRGSWVAENSIACNEYYVMQITGHQASHQGTIIAFAEVSTHC